MNLLVLLFSGVTSSCLCSGVAVSCALIGTAIAAVAKLDEPGCASQSSVKQNDEKESTCMQKHQCTFNRGEVWQL